MNTIVTVILIVSSLVVFTVRAQGFTDLGSFKSPSGNIFCIATRDNFNGKTTVSLSCELNESSAKLGLPVFCGLESSQAARLFSNSAGL